MASQSIKLTLLPDSTQRLANLCGRLNEHIQQIELGMQLKIIQRGNIFQLNGDERAVANGCDLLEMLYQTTESESILSPSQVHLAMQEFLNNESSDAKRNPSTELSALINTPKVSIKPRSKHQRDYVQNIWQHDINFGIGPAGTGKTYLAVACAVEALIKERINRILLVRPAVEAGEKLGFLPGDLSQKIDPYLRPLYDALYEMLGFERVGRLIEKNVIEVAPLAYMRGRTLNNSFIILDEGQNTTTAQMKMFLTRIGFGSTAVITGDVTQIDLPRGERSGLVHVNQVLRNVEGIGFAYFSSHDVVRHRLVQRIVEAYDAFDDKSITPISHQNNNGKHDTDH
ncbi:MAG: PhoH family protein [Gammaproteobacteria bacterium]|nr:PhoH family protein [Gammaproteobacteria bacterium]HBW83228.1 PhoH family protein [Gammaproteobacteria bacterium]|tara:strand:+ start:4752 stop:5777 length:1026 start_codon:yes stop_codon:yes gene_type:complete